MDAKTKREMKDAIQAAREAINAGQYGDETLGAYTVEAGRASYGDGYFEIKVRFAKAGQSPEAEAFRQASEHFGLKAEDLGATFQSANKTFTITGLSPRSVKFPVLADNEDGRGYKFKASTVCRALGREVPDYLQ